jgi:signal peptidase II
MSRIKRAWAYGLLAIVFLLIDRIAKYEAVSFCAQGCKINEYLSFGLVFNRGTSWGLFHSPNNAMFWLVTLGVILITSALLVYTIMRFRAGYMILGELMVLVGSLSNIIDRFLYSGVIDFIELSYRGWVWPSFNGADLLIVFGVLIMMVEQYRK